MAASEDPDAPSLTEWPVSIQREAEADLIEAYWYYEDKSDGLGDQFQSEVEACLALISHHPQAYAAVEGEVRRGLLRRFPYAVFYTIETRRIVVFACFHASRDPTSWRQRL